MKFGQLRRRDWIMVGVIGLVVGGYAAIDSWSEPDAEGEGAAPVPGVVGGPGGEPAAAAPGRATHGGELEGVTRLRPHVVVDRSGFGEPVDAVSVLVPAGWNFESRVVWAGEQGFCSGNHGGVFWKASSPDGAFGIEVSPALLAANSMDQFASRGLEPRGHCMLTEVQSSRDLADRILLPLLRPESRIVEVTTITELPEPIREQAEQFRWTGAGLGEQVTAYGTAVLARSADGTRDETILVFSIDLRFPSPGFGVPGPRIHQVTAPVVIWAPTGQLDEFAPLVGAIASTVRMNPAWLRAVQQVEENISRMQVEGAAQRSQILAQSAREVGEIQMSSWQARQESDFRGADQFGLTMMDMDRRVDSHTGQSVVLQGGGTAYYANAQGEYLVVHAPDVDPRRLFPGEDWRPMASANRPR